MGSAYILNVANVENRLGGVYTESTVSANLIVAAMRGSVLPCTARLSVRHVFVNDPTHFRAISSSGYKT